MGRPKKIKAGSSPDLDQMRKDIGTLIDSFNFTYFHSNSESYNREKAAAITKAIEKQFGKYFTVTEEISRADMRPPFYVSWKVEARI